MKHTQHHFMGYFLCLLLCLFVLPLFSAQAAPWAYTSRKLSYIDSAFYFANHKKWKDARYHAQKVKDPTVDTLIAWMQYQSPSHKASFSDISAFITKHPKWPYLKTLRKHAEEAISPNVSRDVIMRWFKRYPPITHSGKLFLAEEKLRQHEKRLKKPVTLSQHSLLRPLRKAWINARLGKKQEEHFLTRYHHLLRPADYHARIDTLLWQGKLRRAKTMMHEADPQYQQLFRVRMKLALNASDWKQELMAVPPSLQGNDGLLYQKIRWYQKKKKEQDVQRLLRLIKRNAQHPEKWWKLKKQYIRPLLRENKPQEAYYLAASHPFRKGKTFSEAEWLAGWIALRFLNNPREGYKHFYRLYQQVTFPISRARAAYWSGRSAEANNNKSIASNWYKLAARHPDTFYGQLAYHKLHPQRSLTLPTTRKPRGQDIRLFKKNPLAKSSYLLARKGYHGLARAFIMKAVTHARSYGEVVLLTEMGNTIYHPRLSVEAAKYASKRGYVQPIHGYPALDKIPSKPEAALAHAIIRQESAFDPKAKSPAGARGLMQLMPRTARHVSKKLKLRYRKKRLTQNPAYNVKLGSHYLDTLIQKYNGSYILGIAAYNAGEGNVNRWLKSEQIIPLKHSLAKQIDWIEMIPFKETRNYVQRVLENTQMYRQRLHTTYQRSEFPTIEQDIMR